MSTAKPKRVPLRELCARIKAHLKRFEADPEINAALPQCGFIRHTYHQPHAYPSGSRAVVQYTSRRGGFSLSRAVAEAYLAWLDAGGVGTHREVGDRLKAEARNAAPMRWHAASWGKLRQERCAHRGHPAERFGCFDDRAAAISWMRAKRLRAVNQARDALDVAESDLREFNAEFPEEGARSPHQPIAD